jgi:hypothetical protein
MGRRFKFLGQGSEVKGHLKIFTRSSLEELIVACGFTLRIADVAYINPSRVSLAEIRQCIDAYQRLRGNIKKLAAVFSTGMSRGDHARPDL